MHPSQSGELKPVMPKLVRGEAWGWLIVAITSDIALFQNSEQSRCRFEF
jgi:hypothetical protein